MPGPSPTRLPVAIEHAIQCARIADDNRGKEILVLDLRHATPLLDLFVIATAATRGDRPTRSPPRSTRR